MSLQIWLPLDGDLHNQGLFNLKKELNTQSATDIFAEVGKIGNSTLSYNTNTATIFSDTSNNNFISMFGVGKKYSFASWIKLKEQSPGTATMLFQIGYSSATIYPDSASSGYRSFGLNFNSGADNSNPRFVINNGDNGNSGVIHTNVAKDYGVWHHVAYSLDNASNGITTGKIYIDGEKVAEKIFNRNNYSRPDYLNDLNTTSRNNYFLIRPAYAAYNDVRIYDHCLSDKEVEEIYKGLIIHYPLNSDNNGNFGWLLPNYETTLVRQSSTNTFKDYDYYDDLISNSETSYLVDFDAKGSTDGMDIDIYFRSSAGGYVNEAITTKQTLTTDWQHYSLPLELKGGTSLETLWKFRVRCYKGTANDTIKFRNMKLLSNNMPIRENNIYDSSGYCNNGTIIDTLAVSPSSPRYNYATDFSNGYISGIPLTFLDNSNFTISFWAYSANWAAKYGEIRSVFNNYSNKTGVRIYHSANETRLHLQFGIRLKETPFTTGYSTLYFHDEDKDDGANANDDPLKNNTWHHFVVTMATDSENHMVVTTYMDGKKYDYKATSLENYNFNHTVTSNFILQAPEPNEGKISDFRIYVTALTEAQVKELYNTSMSIDNQGNVYARELVE